MLNFLEINSKFKEFIVNHISTGAKLTRNKFTLAVYNLYNEFEELGFSMTDKIQDVLPTNREYRGRLKTPFSLKITRKQKLLVIREDYYSLNPHREILSLVALFSQLASTSIKDFQFSTNVAFTIVWVNLEEKFRDNVVSLWSEQVDEKLQLSSSFKIDVSKAISSFPINNEFIKVAIEPLTAEVIYEYSQQKWIERLFNTIPIPFSKLTLKRLKFFQHVINSRESKVSKIWKETNFSKNFSYECFNFLILNKFIRNRIFIDLEAIGLEKYFLLFHPIDKFYGSNVFNFNFLNGIQYYSDVVKTELVNFNYKIGSENKLKKWLSNQNQTSSNISVIYPPELYKVTESYLIQNPLAYNLENNRWESYTEINNSLINKFKKSSSATLPQKKSYFETVLKVLNYNTLNFQDSTIFNPSEKRIGQKLVREHIIYEGFIMPFFLNLTTIFCIIQNETFSNFFDQFKTVLPIIQGFELRIVQKEKSGVDENALLLYLAVPHHLLSPLLHNLSTKYKSNIKKTVYIGNRELTPSFLTKINNRGWVFNNLPNVNFNVLG